MSVDSVTSTEAGWSTRSRRLSGHASTATATSPRLGLAALPALGPTGSILPLAPSPSSYSAYHRPSSSSSVESELRRAAIAYYSHLSINGVPSIEAFDLMLSLYFVGGSRHPDAQHARDVVRETSASGRLLTSSVSLKGLLEGLRPNTSSVGCLPMKAFSQGKDKGARETLDALEKPFYDIMERQKLWQEAAAANHEGDAEMVAGNASGNVVPSCGVCLEEIHAPPQRVQLTLGCGHSFCSACVYTVRANAHQAREGAPGECPNCHSDIQPARVVASYPL